MVARCLRELGNLKEAYREFQSVASEAGGRGEKYAAAAAAATEEGDEVKQRLAFVIVRVSGAQEGVKVKIGDETIDAAAVGTPIPEDPASVVVTAEASDGSSARAEVTLSAGATETVELALTPPPSNEPPPAPAPEPPKVAVDTSKGIPLRTWAYVAGGVGVAGLATFAVFGSMSNSKYNELSDQCGKTGPCSQDDIDAGKRDQTIANVGLALGIVGLGTGTALFFLGGKSNSADSHASSGVRVHLGTRSLLVQGSF
jgi:hypothetical protein